MDRFTLVACARQFIGVRFAHQGRSRAGLDCLGLLLVTARAAGVQFSSDPMQLHVPDYGLRPNVQLLQTRLAEFLIPISQAMLAPGDVVLLNIDGSPQHLALISDYTTADALGMIHAYAPAHKVVEHRYDAVWQHNTHTCYSLPTIAA